MRFAVVVFACVLAAVSAQQYFPQNKGQYFPQNDQYNYNRYNKFNYNNNYNRYPNQNRWGGNYQPFVQPTPFPRPVVPVKPVVVTPAPAVSVEAKPSPAPVQVPVVPQVVVSEPKPSPVVPVSSVRVAADDRSAEVLKFGNEISENGFNYYFESNNGIAAQAQGVPRNFGGNPPVVPDVIQGAFSWISPEGKVISISYTADENGYQPSGDAIPQPPEVPAQIARALEYSARYLAGAKN
ncbi:larval cuticle protein LCP-22-like [Danaus plexippus]|uniref:Larval cuticle protein LCP-22 n=1 Tax=Danaus plexippus plexippus TaxID=278856 RepID=A0A212EXV2_DANPL|nr:larval cuticle protein LCP-22-like [Danaus plexippus]OWR46315.1 larval cuticle protein LCP-22 precursor [Danaus plexippus plexippus]